MPSNLWLMILLYRKQSGGYRPIGLLPSFIRLWECCRVCFLWEYEAANVRPYNFAVPGCSSLQVIRSQGLYIEGAPRGCTSVLTLLDLVKAYEHVRHQRIFKERSTLILIYVFYILCSMSSAWRGICISGAVSDSLCVVGVAILAGSRFGPAMLRMALTRSLDQWAARWPYMQLFLYIDDIGVLARGTPSLF